MYVDKRLGGVNAVQTLSRLNRVYPGKEETAVLDFANDADDIQKAFEPYYDRTILTEATDPNLLYNLETRLEEFHFYGSVDVNRFATAYFSPKSTLDKLYAAVGPVVARYEAAPEDDRVDFRGTLQDYVRLYAFLSQILPFSDASLEKLYVFGRLLLRKLPVKREKLPVEIQQQIDLESQRIHKTRSGSISLQQRQGKLEPIRAKASYRPAPDEIEVLSQIIKDLNERFGTSFTPEDRVFIEQLEAKLADDAALKASVRINPPESARLTFDHVVNDKLQDMIDTNFKFYKQITDNKEFGRMFLDWLFDRFRSSAPARGPGAERSQPAIPAHAAVPGGESKRK